MTDKITARGEVDILIYKDGKLLFQVNEKNLVVTLGKKNICRLLGGDVVGKAITKIGVGDSSAAATVADSSLSNPFVKAIDSVTYPDDQSVMFHFELTDADANGLTIREFGLFNDNSILLARKIRIEEIVKTNAIRLVGTWKLTVN